MAENHTWTPDLGYWAVAVDPLGPSPPHPLRVPARRQLGGGERSPTRGRRPSSLAARRCARCRCCSRCSASCSRPTPRAGCRGGRRAGDGWLAIWFVGLLSPILFYGADFWEHAPALALAPVRGRPGARRRRTSARCSAACSLGSRRSCATTCWSRSLRSASPRSSCPRSGKRSLARWRELAAGCVALAGVLFVNLRRSSTGCWHPARARLAPAVAARRSPTRSAVASATRSITSVGVLANEYWLALVIGAVIGIAHPADGSGRRRPFSGPPRSRGSWARSSPGAALVWRFAALGISTVPGFLCAAPSPRSGSSASALVASRCSSSASSIAIPIVWMTEWVGGTCPSVGWPVPASADRASRRPRGGSGAGASGRAPSCVALAGARRRDERRRGRVARRAHSRASHFAEVKCSTCPTTW